VGGEKREGGREGVPFEPPEFFFGGQANVTREGFGLEPVSELRHVVLLVGRGGGMERRREGDGVRGHR